MSTTLSRTTWAYNGLVLNQTSAITSASVSATSWYKVNFVNLDLVEARNVQDNKAIDDGIEDYDTFLGLREVLISGALVASSETVLTEYAQELRKAFNPRLTQIISAATSGYLPLTWSETMDGVDYTLRIEAKPSKPPEMDPYEEEAGGLVSYFRCFLKARDPRKYDDTITSGSLTSGTSAADIVNYGDYPTYPTLVITGPACVPTVYNLTTGEYFTVSTTLSAGQEVSVSMIERIMSGSTNYYQYKTSGSNFPWWVSAGTVTIGYGAITVGASTCAYSFRSAWI